MAVDLMSDFNEEIQSEISRLIEKQLSLELATVSDAGKPNASYAPYVYGDRLHFYVFLSDLAQHTRNIRSNPNVSLMVIEDESSSQNLFARNRLVLECKAVKMSRDSEEFKHWISCYKERFGAIVDTLTQLTDFNLYELAPSHGVFVIGFGQAYQITGDKMNEIKHITNPARQANLE